MAQFHQTSVATHRTIPFLQQRKYMPLGIRLRLKCDGTRADTRFRLPAKRTSPFKSAGTSVQSTTGSRGVSITCSNAGYTMFRGTYSIRHFPFHFPSRASPCATTFQLDSTFGAFTFLTVQVSFLLFWNIARRRWIILHSTFYPWRPPRCPGSLAPITKWCIAIFHKHGDLRRYFDIHIITVRI